MDKKINDVFELNRWKISVTIRTRPASQEISNRCLVISNIVWKTFFCGKIWIHGIISGMERTLVTPIHYIIGHHHCSMMSWSSSIKNDVRESHNIISINCRECFDLDSVYIPTRKIGQLPVHRRVKFISSPTTHDYVMIYYINETTNNIVNYRWLI